MQIGQQRISAAKKVIEQHKEVWLLWIVHYLTNCKTFLEAGRQQLVTLNEFDDLPSCIKFPKTGWLLTVYCLHVLLRIQQVKALITTILWPNSKICPWLSEPIVFIGFPFIMDQLYS